MCVALGAGASLAAPSHPDAPDVSEASESDEDLAGNGLALRLGSDAAAEGRVLDVLVQMQARNAGLRFNERMQRPEAPARRVAKPLTGDRAALQSTAPVDAGKAKPLPVSKAGLFGSGTAAATAQLPNPVRNPSPVTVGDSAGGLRYPVRPAPGEPLPAWLSWPRDAILYLRENRVSVLGGVAAALLLLGAGSWLRTRRRA